MSSAPSKQDRSPRLGSLLRLATQLMTEHYAEWLARSGYAELQPTHSAVIQPLWEYPEGIRLTTLARSSRITKQSMSALVDHLEKHGYVERAPDPSDARASLVRLTARGKSFARALRACSDEMEKDWSARVGARRVDELKSVLEALRHSWLDDAG